MWSRRWGGGRRDITENCGEKWPIIQKNVEVDVPHRAGVHELELLRVLYERAPVVLKGDKGLKGTKRGSLRERDIIKKREKCKGEKRER